MDIIHFLYLSLAVWRISILFTAEAGPFNVFKKLRSLKMGGLFDCIYCTSMYVGFFAMLLYLWDMDRVLIPFALSGAALMLRSYTGAGLHDVSSN